MADILLIQDSPSINALIRFRLEKAGFSIEAVETGAEGMRRINTGSYRLVLLDVNLPDANGADLAARIRDIPSAAAIPLVFLSACEEEELKVMADVSSAAGYICLPVDADILLRTVRALLMTSGKG